MRALLASPRRRRRLAWSSAVFAAAATAVTVGILYPNTAKTPMETFGPGKPVVYHEPETVKISNRSRAEALATAANFVKTAVVRRNVDDSWTLVAPGLKQGYTRARWANGEIPVVPYPAEGARWRLEYSYPGALGLKVLLFPRRDAGVRPNLFDMELTRAGSGARAHWVVSSWTPSGGPSVPDLAAPGSGGGSLVSPVIQPGAVTSEARLGAAWLLVPLGLLGVVPLILIGFAARSWYRGRKAAREYARTASPAELPPLKSYSSTSRPS